MSVRSKRVGLVMVVAFGLAVGAAIVWQAAGRPVEARGVETKDGSMKGGLAEPGTYKIDSRHSFAYFGARHHVVGLVRGRFDQVAGTIVSSRVPAECIVDVTIQVASLSTQVAERDEDIRGADYFDAKKFPEMTYRGKGIRRGADGMWVMDGSLTMHGVTRVVPLTFAFNGVFKPKEAGKPVRAAFHGTAGVKRAEFGMGARDNLDELGKRTDADVAIEIDVEADSQ